jgi:hypothetical protein
MGRGYVDSHAGVNFCFKKFCELRLLGILGNSTRHTDLVNPPSTRMFCPVM